MKGICFFVTSTFGNGTHPTSAASISEWLDVKLNDSEENLNERLNTVLQTHVETNPANEASKQNWVVEESASQSQDGKEQKLPPPLITRKSAIMLGKLPTRKSSVELGKRNVVKTMSRRISMATFSPENPEFSQLR